MERKDENNVPQSGTRNLYATIVRLNKYESNSTLKMQTIS